MLIEAYREFVSLPGAQQSYRKLFMNKRREPKT